jgi:glycerol-1-phosphate dehydrogenase [NAD(P)+]
VSGYPDPVLVTPGALGALPPWLKARGYKTPLLICDEKTFSAAAEELEAQIRTQGLDSRMALLASPPVLADELRVVEAFLKLTPEVDIVVSVGGGTLTDIARFLAHRGNRPFVAVPTAASVDGFYSIGAPLILRGVKRTVLCRPPKAIFADTEVLSGAPARLGAAGFGDLVGKLTSWADWNLGRILWNEPFDEKIAATLFSVAQKTMQASERMRSPKEETQKLLMDLLIVSGGCMVDAGESRPASGAEHHLSHYWEMSFLRHGEEPPLHGAKVGYATQIVAALYRHLLHLNPGDLEVPLDDALPPDGDEAARIRNGYPEDIATQLVEDQHDFLKLASAQRRTLARRILDSWPEIRGIAERVPEPAEITRALDSAGAPTRAERLGIEPTAVSEALRYAHYLRNRFTVLKLYRFLGIEPEPVAREALGGF